MARRNRSPSFDNLSVAAFDERLHATLRDLGVDVAIRETPYGIPTTTPFAQDVEHAAYDPHAVERFWRILDWTDGVFESFSGWYCGKTSPVHLFWHSLDLAVTRFDGERSPDVSAFRPVDREAYSHNVVSFGSWAGDRDVREPTFYAYAAPEPAGLRAQALRPDEARWVERAGGSLAVLAYEAVRVAPDPRRTLLAFLESAYQAGAGLGGWDRRELASTWCPPPGELHDLLGRLTVDALDGNAMAGDLQCPLRSGADDGERHLRGLRRQSPDRRADRLHLGDRHRGAVQFVRGRRHGARHGA